jgi:two-component system response regulator AtoC
MQGTVLLVDDEQHLISFLKKLLDSEGYDTKTALTGEEARQKAALFYPDVMVLDIRLPDADGVELMRELKQTYPHAQYIMMTAHGSIQTAVESTRLGAFEYLTKPVEPDVLLVSLQNAMKARRLTEEVEELRRKSRLLPGSSEITIDQYRSPAFRMVADEAHRAIDSDATVLLTGESGTGKNHLSRWIHEHSGRADGPFFEINCASIALSLVESELFGYEPGAFTGSQGRKRGLLEMADQGTLLLDEIGDMDLALQAKLLTFLDTQVVRRLGSETNIKVNARIIAATNQDLEKLVQEKKFRQDLYYRLNVLVIDMPPLRRRTSDITILAKELLMRLAHEMDLKDVPRLGPEALSALERYHWPGNVREMRNVLERSLLEASSYEVINHVALGPKSLASFDLSPVSQTDQSLIEVRFPDQGLNLKETLNQLTATLIKEALARGATKKQAAELLGISRHSLTHYLKALDIHA